MAMRRPDGTQGPLLLSGRGRDLLTVADGLVANLYEDALEAEIAPPCTLAMLSTQPRWPELDALLDANAIQGFRRRLAAALLKRPDRERPLGTLLDDIAATSLISGWVMTLMPNSPLREFRKDPARRRRMEGTCTGFSPGSDAFADEFEPGDPVRVPPLQVSEDDLAWHIMDDAAVWDMRRARRIDVWRKDDRVMVDAMFQDSALLPDGTQAAVHDYGIAAEFDETGSVLISLTADPRILPHDACPGAVANIGRLTGSATDALRSRVLDDLRGVAGCTHLNDAIRALAAVPMLTAALRAAESPCGERVDA
jgi:hypothetical protein